MARKPNNHAGFRLCGRNRGGGTRTPNPRFWRPVLCQLSYAPGFDGRLYPGVSPRSRRGGRHDRLVARFGMAALFVVITVAFAGIGVAAAHAGRWVIAVAAAALAFWMASLASSALRKRRR